MSNDSLSARLRAWLSSHPVSRYSLLSLLAAGFVFGVLFWGGYNTAMDISNTEAFCITCHEMEENVYHEYQETVHYSNETGVRAICSDCHVPKEWQHKAVRKLYAVNELYHKILGTVNTPEKFEAKRGHMAANVWRSMRETDSRECRNCHAFEYMKLDEQDRFAKRKHERGEKKGETCIDCHQGVAHKLPEDWKAVWKEEFGET